MNFDEEIKIFEKNQETWTKKVFKFFSNKVLENNKFVETKIKKIWYENK